VFDTHGTDPQAGKVPTIMSSKRARRRRANTAHLRPRKAPGPVARIILLPEGPYTPETIGADVAGVPDVVFSPLTPEDLGTALAVIKVWPGETGLTLTCHCGMIAMTSITHGRDEIGRELEHAAHCGRVPASRMPQDVAKHMHDVLALRPMAGTAPTTGGVS
jgi:hypothetical protein